MHTFEQVIDEFGPALARIAASYERNQALREELQQDIMFCVFQALPQLKDSAKIRPFVFRIAHNCCVDHVVKHAGLPATDGVHAELQSNELTPEQQLLGNERTLRLVEAIRRLDLPYRQVMTLLLEDMSYGDIAESLGISVTNVGVRVNRAKIQLKGLLHHDG